MDVKVHLSSMARSLLSQRTQMQKWRAAFLLIQVSTIVALL